MWRDDLWSILGLIGATWVSLVSLEYEQRTLQDARMYSENMAVLWVEAESTTQRLKQCEKRKRK